MPQTDADATGSPGRAAVVYFAKVPRPGQVKTRLCPPLTPAEAAGLYRAFLSDGVRPIPGVRTLCYGWPEAALGELEPLVGPDVELRPQRGPDLWARLNACFAELFAEGHDAVVVRNTDSPDLPTDVVQRALAACRPDRVVLGPDLGGGYYLVGLGRSRPELFDGVVEGAPTAYAATVERARALALEVVELEPRGDVDTFDDLLEMWRRR